MLGVCLAVLLEPLYSRPTKLRCKRARGAEKAPPEGEDVVRERLPAREMAGGAARPSWSTGALRLLGTLALLFLAVAPSAHADFGIPPGGFAASSSSPQAGAHGDYTTEFRFNTVPDPVLIQAPDGNARSLSITLPPGVVGNAQAYPKCTSEYLALQQYCPMDTQIGVINYVLAFPNVGPVNVMAPLYNMEPPASRPAEFGFENLFFLEAQIHILLGVDAAYRVVASMPALPGNLKIQGASVTIWGVPADSSHDTLRGSSVEDPSDSIAGRGCLTAGGPSASGDHCPSGAPVLPFLRNPTSCGEAESASMLVDAWENPGVYFGPVLSDPQAMTGCEKLVFEPSLSLQPEARTRGVPSGFEAVVHVPQTDSPVALGTPDVRKVVVRLPEGVVVSPSAANGLEGCSDAQVGIGSEAHAVCPDGSKIGTVKVITPLLPDPLEGAVYQGTQLPGHLLRLFVVAEGHGVKIKLPGSVDLDPVTGQITTTFDGTPQLPFEEFILHFAGGPNAPLSTPRTCGLKQTDATLTSWAGNVATTSDGFVISGDGNGAPCPAYGFDPVLHSGVTKPIAGASSSFALTFSRTDQDQLLGSATVMPPPGLLAKVKGVTLCKQLDAAAGRCPAASRIGTVTTSAGPGPDPFTLSGQVFLTGRYRGKPFGLSIVVPAKAGPLDLGNVVVRAAIDVRDDGSIQVASDPLPTILQGIPLQIRSVTVEIDRAGFMVNPTNCRRMRVRGAISSVDGAQASPSARFQIGDCGRLPFHPRMRISVGRKGHTRAGASVPLTATLTQTAGQAGMKTVSVALPGALTSHLEVLTHACTREEFDAGSCSTRARAGFATAVSPLLNRPLHGGVFFVKRAGAQPGALPDLIVALRGEVDINLVGTVKLPHNGALIQTTFKTVPDVPVSRFSLHLLDGTQGPIGATENLCSAKARRARVGMVFRAQNGKLIRARPRLAIHGCG